MRRRLAGLALALYPLAFRRRYGEEMHALLDEAPIGTGTLLDLFRGVLVAHLRPSAGAADAVDRDDRLRASMSGVLACWIVFAAAGFAFAVTTEDPPFVARENSHPLLGGAHLAVQALALVASFALVLGALPLIAVALNRARRQRSLRTLVSLPIIAVAVFAALTGLLVWIANSQHTHHATAASRIAFILWGLVGLACGAVCVIAARKALFAVPVARRRLVAAYACGALITTAMVAMAFATALYTLALSVDASRLAAAPNGPLDGPSVGVSLILQLVVMVFACTLAAITTLRGAGALRLGSGSRTGIVM